jgi:hypothetical protein
VSVRTRGGHPERDPVALDAHRAFQAALATVDRGRAGLVSATGRFGDAPIDAEVGQLKTDDQVIGGERDRMQSLGEPETGPLFEPAADGAIRTVPRGDSLIADPCTNASMTCSNTTRSGIRRRW